MKPLRQLLFLTLTIYVVETLADNQAHQEANNQTVTIALYYESMCPDCAVFMRDQLIPVWKRLGRYLNIDLVPYGNAYTTYKNKEVLCQHGVNECAGNIMHACALKYFTTKIPLEFISCTEKLHVPPVSLGPTCATQLGLDFKLLETCLKGPEGYGLLVANGDRTNNLRPKHEWVPWTLFNGLTSKDDMAHAEKDLQSVVCKYLNPPPTECNEI